LEALPGMAFFASLGKAEATRGTGRWSLDNREKRKRLCSSDRGKTVWRSGVFTAAQPEWLTSRRAGRWSLDNKEKRKRLCSSDRGKTVWQSGVFTAAQPEWLTSRRAGRWSLDNKEKRKLSKSRSPIKISNTKHSK